MRSLIFPIAAIAAVWLTPAAGASGDPARLSVLNHEEIDFIGMQLETEGSVTASRFRDSLAPGSISFRAFGRQFDLRLTDNDTLRPDRREPHANDTGPPAARYRLLQGRLAGEPGSWARLAIIGEHLEGVIRTDEALIAIGPAATLRHALVHPPRDPSAHIAYRLEDTLISPGAMTCRVQRGDPRVASAASAYQQLAAELRDEAATAALSATRQLELSAVADREFIQDFGAGSEAALLSRFNIVDGIFSEQVGVRIRVTEMLLSEQDDIFNSNDPITLLEQLADLRAATPELRSTGLTHLYTGRNLEDDTVGIAYLDSLCSTRFGAGVSQGGRTQMSDALVAAHEIGHNFGAVHDGEPPCENTGGIFLMAPTQNGSDQFSQCSLDTILPAAAAAGCVTAVSDVEVSLSVSPASVERLQTREVSLTFLVLNDGAGEASDVLLDIDIPSGLTVSETDPSRGSCTTAAGGVSCALGVLGSGASSSIGLVLETRQSGIFPVNATVQAIGDATPDDNGATAFVTVNPAVDLSVAFVGGAVNIRQSASASRTVTVSNSAIGPASDVEITVSAPAGLDLTDANPDRGSCTVTAREIVCQVSSLPEADTASVTIVATGRQAGSYAVDARVAASEGDLDTSDDTATLSYTVTAAASSGGGGGGGGLIGIELLLLACMLIARRRSR